MSGTKPTADTSLKGKGRRRSQRIYLLIPLEVSWATIENAQIKERAETEEVNAHGALLWVKNPPPAGTTVKLTHGHTGNSTIARVVAERNLRPTGYRQVSVELAVPSYAFWGVNFPPARPTGTSTG